MGLGSVYCLVQLKKQLTTLVNTCMLVFTNKMPGNVSMKNCQSVVVNRSGLLLRQGRLLPQSRWLKMRFRPKVFALSPLYQIEIYIYMFINIYAW